MRLRMPTESRYHMTSEQDMKVTCLNFVRMQIKRRKYWIGKPNEIKLTSAEIYGIGKRTNRMNIVERIYK